MAKLEEFHDELASLNFNERENKQPLHRNPKFFLPVGIGLIVIIIIIAVTTSGGSNEVTSSSSILPGISDGGSSDKNFNSVPVVTPTAPPRTNPPTMPPTTSPPTASPVAAVVYNSPSVADCQAIARGQNVAGQNTMIQHSFNVPIDVVLSDSKSVSEAAIVQELQSKIQSKLMPDMAGCMTRRRLRNGSSDTETENHRQLATPNVVANAQSQVTAQLVECQMSSALNCLHVLVSMKLYLKGDENSNALVRLISDTFAPPEGVVNKLELSESIMGLWINSVAVSAPVVTPPKVSVPSPNVVAPTPSPTVTGIKIDGIKYDEDDDEVDEDLDADDLAVNGDDDDLVDDGDDDDLANGDDDHADDDAA